MAQAESQKVAAKPDLIYHVSFLKTQTQLLTDTNGWGAPAHSTSPGLAVYAHKPGAAGMGLTHTRPPAAIGVLSVGEFTTPVQISKNGKYLLEATFQEVNSPRKANDIWAPVVSIKEGNDSDAPNNLRVVGSLQFRKDAITGKNMARVNLPSMTNVAPPEQDVAQNPADYAYITSGFPKSEFKMELEFSQATTDVKLTVTIGGNTYVRTGKMPAGHAAANLTAVGVALASNGGDGVGSMICREFKLHKYP